MDSHRGTTLSIVVTYDLAISPHIEIKYGDTWTRATIYCHHRVEARRKLKAARDMLAACGIACLAHSVRVDSPCGKFGLTEDDASEMWTDAGGHVVQPQNEEKDPTPARRSVLQSPAIYASDTGTVCPHLALHANTMMLTSMSTHPPASGSTSLSTNMTTRPPASISTNMTTRPPTSVPIGMSASAPMGMSASGPTSVSPSISTSVPTGVSASANKATPQVCEQFVFGDVAGDREVKHGDAADTRGVRSLAPESKRPTRELTTDERAYADTIKEHMKKGGHPDFAVKIEKTHRYIRSAIGSHIGDAEVEAVRLCVLGYN